MGGRESAKIPDSIPKDGLKVVFHKHRYGGTNSLHQQRLHPSYSCLILR